MLITLNGAATEVADGTPLTALLPTERRGTAVALNGEVVPQPRIADRRLVSGDRIEIVTAVQGG
ncbi:sulfur carrier protein [Nocardioides daedukensis]|uniref:Sulfur carrier protein n=1 Tax=Nocardioides daedukensis TaxID=634462 RepID=A0A7Y9UW33_9ACTN|nr:sulfur carrier protein ThiS [Nocardioides daedukensis]NYG60345.1 sulfur carrier protein [Nocardioides daedukensis]